MRLISRVARPSFWRSRARSRQWAFRRSQLAAAARDRLDDHRGQWRLALSLARQSSGQIVVGFLLVATAELVARAAAGSDLAAIRLLGSRAEGDTYRDLLAAGVGTIGALLGLYYATVGVVASTAYQSVPGSIRALFVQEPSGRLYVAGVVRAGVFGLAELTLASLGLVPPAVALVLFAILSLNALLRLMILGGRIFNFFDPSSLATALNRRLAGAVRRAVSLQALQREGAQASARVAAQGALSTYLDLAVLLEGSKARNAAGPQRLTAQLLRVATWYSSVKSRIPTDSAWWEREPSHQNWMTLDHVHLEMSLMTGAGVTPDLEPNRLWVEQSIARVLDRTFMSSYQAGGSPSALTFARGVSRASRLLAGRLQVAEALTLDRVWGRAVRSIISEEVQTEDPGVRELNQLAAAEEVVMPLTNLWLGIGDAAERLGRVDIAETFRLGIAKRASIYSASLPNETLKLVEELLDSHADELSAEARAVTPEWWHSHIVARSLAREIVTACERFMAEIDGPLAQDVATYSRDDRAQVPAVVATASIELFHKVEVGAARIEAGLRSLASHRRPILNDPRWPESPQLVEWARQLQRANWLELARLLPRLRVDRHDPRVPDLHGQVFQHVFDAAFEAILDGDQELAVPLYAAVLNEADVMRLRVAKDLSGRDDQMRIVFAFEPVVGLLELSGYALLMQEIDGTGIWPQVQNAWDALLAGDDDGTRAVFFTTAAVAVESVLGMSTGGLRRSARMQQLNRLLDARGLVAQDGWQRRRSGRDARPPLTAALGAGNLGLSHDLSNLFIIEYLQGRLPDGAELPRRAALLAESIARARSRRSGTAPDSGSGAADTSAQEQPPSEPDADGGEAP